MFAPTGTHCTRVGSPSLQISGDEVTPVVAYPSGHAPQVILILFGSVASCAILREGNATTRTAPIAMLYKRILPMFLTSSGISLPPCKLLKPFADELF